MTIPFEQLEACHLPSLLMLERESVASGLNLRMGHSYPPTTPDARQLLS